MSARDNDKHWVVGQDVMLMHNKETLCSAVSATGTWSILMDQPHSLTEETNAAVVFGPNAKENAERIKACVAMCAGIRKPEDARILIEYLSGQHSGDHTSSNPVDRLAAMALDVLGQPIPVKI